MNREAENPLVQLVRYDIKQLVVLRRKADALAFQNALRLSIGNVLSALFYKIKYIDMHSLAMESARDTYILVLFHLYSVVSRISSFPTLQRVVRLNLDRYTRRCIAAISHLWLLRSCAYITKTKIYM